MEAASPDLEKQGFFAVVFVNREYSVQPDPWGTPKFIKSILLFLLEFRKPSEPPYRHFWQCIDSSSPEVL
jgi:hypothetical protein